MNTKQSRPVAVWVAVSVLLASCGWITSDRDDMLDVPRDADGVETWDLRSPPTAKDVGLEESFDEAIFSTLDPRPVRILLPDDRVIEAELTTVTFDNHLTPDRGIEPTGMNLHTAAFPIREAMERLEVHLAELGMDATPVESWAADIASSEDRRPVRGGSTTIVGYLAVGVGGRFTFEDRASTLSWGVGWDPLTLDEAHDLAGTPDIAPETTGPAQEPVNP